IVTFELMSNHLHLTLSGRETDVMALFNVIKCLLSKGLDEILSDWECKTRMLNSLSELRNVITYNNRNGYVVHPDETPFTYPWGANMYYFNPVAKQRFYESGKPLSFNEKRKMLASHKGDSVKDLLQVDGYVSPMCFCDICLGESFFRGASHYFNEISRNIESQKDIASEIGESIFYTDDELFRIVLRWSKDKYDTFKPSLLPKEAKIELANKMHSEYHSGNKQIQRILNLPASVVAGMFPSS
ncbi:MAG: hypothetical protein IKH11_06265, partial [Bacteroidales bacterium]|nr:hypothetical protein [Bacteroidales bacterium]